MKIFYNLIVVLISLFSSFSMAGHSGGGGNSENSSYPATAEEIRQVVENLKPGLILAAHKLQTFTDYSSQISELSKKESNHDFLSKLLEFQNLALKPFYVSNPKTNIYAAIRRARFTVEMTKPCYEDDGKTESDGSVITNDGSICISAERLIRDVQGKDGKILRRKLMANELYKELTALGFHEISHSVGFDESHAQNVQMLVRDNVTNEMILKLGAEIKYIEAQISSFLFDSQQLSKQIRATELSSTDPDDMAKATNSCLALGMLIGRIDSFTTSMGSDPMVQDTKILSIVEMTSLSFVLESKLRIASYYCLGPKSIVMETDFYIHQFAPKFNGNPRTPLKAFNTQDMSKSFPRDYNKFFANFMVSNSIAGGLPAVELEVSEVSKMLLTLGNSVRARWAK